MAWFGQYLGTAYTGQWWGDDGAIPPIPPSPGNTPAGRRTNRRRRFASRREFTIGDKKYAIENDGQLEAVVADLVSEPVRVARVPKAAPARPVNAEPRGPIYQWTPADLPRIDLRAVEVLRAQSERLGQEDVILALDRLMRRAKQLADMDEDDVEMLLLQ